jgi:hypothetical protein
MGFREQEESQIALLADDDLNTQTIGFEPQVLRPVTPDPSCRNEGSDTERHANLDLAAVGFLIVLVPLVLAALAEWT